MSGTADHYARRRGHQLANLRLFWGDWYVIDGDSTVFTGTRRDDPTTTLRRSTADGLHRAILADHTSRPIRPVADYD